MMSMPELRYLYLSKINCYSTVVICQAESPHVTFANMANPSCTLVGSEAGSAECIVCPMDCAL
jgi:hypothetical protein